MGIEEVKVQRFIDLYWLTGKQNLYNTKNKIPMEKDNKQEYKNKDH